MPVCISCKGEIAVGAKFCPECGAAILEAHPPGGPPGPSRGPEGATVSSPNPASSSSSPSSSIHGRFEPGTRLGVRYRVVGLLGRGGMGEVYRADDLELNQSVALKFLPERVARNPADLARLRQEVRTARQIAHPNVCRTYDISEADGQVFVVMEYVDGEDLASVLRRLGRPTPDKALEIARQLCLGIGAAHENGVLHRDLKPANIMIDGRGRVRITDFGLAGTAEEIAAEKGTAGTPAYMAPEQLRSGTASAQSDIFSLGLVLYELFTGKRAADMTPAPDPERPGSDSSVRTPSSLVGDVDPAVERVILRCLERDPARRPQSAYAVFGALPGGDPLAAAVAAGETPSPQLVANAGVEGSVRPLHAGLAVLFIIAGIAGISAIQKPLFQNLGRSPQVLSVRAEEILTQTTGGSPPRYSNMGLRYAHTLADTTALPAPGVDARRPKTAGAKQFWRRWSPVPLEVHDIHNPGSTLRNPPQAYPGSASVVLDTGGRLLALSVVPGPWLDTLAVVQPDWGSLLRAAGRDPFRAKSTTPPQHLLARADTVVAWTVSDSGAPDTTIVAAAIRGRVVQMDTYVRGGLLGDLAVRPLDDAFGGGPQTWVLILCLAVIPFVGSIILAVRNVRMGRVDMRGGLVAGIVIAALYLLNYLFTVRPGELGALRVIAEMTAGAPMGHCLFHAVAMFLGYLAIEPYARRLWPRVLVSWARLVSGRARDPIVGRDILGGLALGVFNSLLWQLYQYLARHLGLTSEPLTLAPPTLSAMIDPRSTLAALSLDSALGILRATTGLTLLLVLRFILRRNRAAAVGMIVLFTLMFITYGQKSTWLELGISLVLNTVLVLLFLRFGFLFGMVTLATDAILQDLPWTADLSGWLVPQTMLGWAFVGGAMAYAFTIAVRGHSIFKDPLSDPVAKSVRPRT